MTNATAEPEATNVPESPRPSRRHSRGSQSGRGGSVDPSREVVEALEAVVLACDRPVPDARLAEVLQLPADPPPAAVIEAAAARLNEDFERTGRVFRIRRVAGGWRVLIQPRHHDLLERLKGQRTQAKLSPAALETLAIVAYRQPIVRAEIEAIRGVASGEVLRTLLDRRLVRITGRAEELGRPMLYGTTREFLQIFGLANLSDLPQRREFAGEAKPRRTATTSRAVADSASPQEAAAESTSERSEPLVSDPSDVADDSSDPANES